jgi:hypothetical protein
LGSKEEVMAIDISKLTKADIGRKATYHREHCAVEHGVLTSWNKEFVFVQFKGPQGEACCPEDVSFSFLTLEEAFPQSEEARSFDESVAAIRAAGGEAWDEVPSVADAISEIRGVPQSVDECVEQLVAAIDRIEDSFKRREAIYDVLHRLEFERRFELLNAKQRAHMLDTSLTNEQLKALEAAKSKSAKAFDNLVSEYARSLYFRRAAWVSYLNGEGDPPIVG